MAPLPAYLRVACLGGVRSLSATGEQESCPLLWGMAGKTERQEPLPLGISCLSKQSHQRLSFPTPTLRTGSKSYQSLNPLHLHLSSNQGQSASRIQINA